MDDSEGLRHEEITSAILGASFDVLGELGPGYPESVYKGALGIAVRRRGLKVDREKPMEVRYQGEVVGQFYADLWVADCVVVEVKAVKVLVPEHFVQTINYLTAAKCDVGLLLNFGSPRFEYRRLHGRGVTDDPARTGRGASCE